MKKVWSMAGLIAAAILISSGLLWFAAERYTPPGIPVLNYHRINGAETDRLTLSPAEFERQMAYLYGKGYRTIKPDQLLEYMRRPEPLPEKVVLITFDDGYVDNYTEAFPIMNKYGYTGAVFVITDRIGTEKGYMTWEQAEGMRKPGGSIVGGSIFGSHTLDHAVLTRLTPENVLFELEKSKEGMQWKLDVPIKYFAYPTGAHNQQVRDLVCQAGYQGAFTVDFGRVQKDSDVYALPRIPILKSWFTFADFYLRLHFTPQIGAIKRIKEKVLPGPAESSYN